MISTFRLWLVIFFANFYIKLINKEPFVSKITQWLNILYKLKCHLNFFQQFLQCCKIFFNTLLHFSKLEKQQWNLDKWEAPSQFRCTQQVFKYIVQQFGIECTNLYNLDSSHMHVHMWWGIQICTLVKCHSWKCTNLFVQCSPSIPETWTGSSSLNMKKNW